MDIRKIILEEVDDLQWIKDTKPTFGQYFDSGLLNVGDVFYLSGVFDDGGGRNITIHNTKFTVEKVNPLNFVGNSLSTTNKVVLKHFNTETSPKKFVLLEFDRDLTVDKYIPKTDS